MPKTFLPTKYVDQFEKEYNKLRDDLIIQKDGESVELYNAKLHLANTMENAWRVFLHFSSTGRVELSALD